jgi:histone-lysine N-methyltransferase SETMAR
VKEWAKQFRLRRESIEDDPHQGRPAEALTPETIALVQEEVLQDRRLKTKEISASCGLSKTMVLRILHNHLGVKKVSARWVPKLLSVVQKQRRVEYCTEYLTLCEGQEKEVIESIVRGDDTMVLYHDPLSKRESMEWRHLGSPRPKAKATQSRKKITATIFWDCHGILPADFKQRNTTVTGEYSASSIYKLKDATKEKRQGKLSRGVRLLRDNAPAHTSVAAKAAVQCCGLQELNHPPYSPGIAPSDYSLFSKLKSDLRGKKFTGVEKVISAVSDHFKDKNSEYF